MSDRSEQLESILREHSHSGDSRLGFGDAAPQPEDGPSSVIGRVAGTRVPVSGANFLAFLSPDAKWLAMPLLDGSTTSLWALPSAGDEWRRRLDFGERNVMIARRIAWSNSGRHVYASVSDVDSDIVLLAGLTR